MVGEVGLEPTKAKPADLQSAPFAARDTPPRSRRVLRAPQRAGQVRVCRFTVILNNFPNIVPMPPSPARHSSKPRLATQAVLQCCGVLSSLPHSEDIWPSRFRTKCVFSLGFTGRAHKCRQSANLSQGRYRT